MDFKSLHYFRVLSETHSFTEAADSIPMTVQGLRRSIRLLEDELGVSLYVRGAEQLSFSEAGEKFYKFCVNELEQYDEMSVTMNELRRGKGQNSA